MVYRKSRVPGAAIDGNTYLQVLPLERRKYSYAETAIDLRDVQVEIIQRHFGVDWTQVITASDYQFNDWNMLV